MYEYIFILLMNLDGNLNERIRIYTERCLRRCSPYALYNQSLDFTKRISDLVYIYAKLGEIEQAVNQPHKYFDNLAFPVFQDLGSRLLGDRRERLLTFI